MRYPACTAMRLPAAAASGHDYTRRSSDDRYGDKIRAAWGQPDGAASQRRRRHQCAEIIHYILNLLAAQLLAPHRHHRRAPHGSAAVGEDHGFVMIVYIAPGEVGRRRDELGASHRRAARPDDFVVIPLRPRANLEIRVAVKLCRPLHSITAFAIA